MDKEVIQRSEASGSTKALFTSPWSQLSASLSQVALSHSATSRGTEINLLNSLTRTVDNKVIALVIGLREAEHKNR